MPKSLLVILFAGAALACRAGAPAVPPTLLVIAVDGLRHDQLNGAALPHLGRLEREGVRAPLVPVFPTKTFPNWYTLATGLYPEQHGIVANTMYDPEFDAWFRMDDRAAVTDGRWWGGEPIWITAERQGIRAAPMFWPGSEAEIRGRRPSYWLPFDDHLPNEARIAQLFAWLDLPAAERPGFASVYFSVVDVAGHDYGPESPEAMAALEELDRLVGLLLDGLTARGLTERVNLIVLSDHGQGARRPDQIIFLDDLLPPGIAEVIDWSPVLQLRPGPGLEDSVVRVLQGRHPHLAVYRKPDLPPRWHYRDSPRVQPIVAVAAEGWEITTRERFARYPHLFGGGSHGWDPALPSMHGLFLGRGPAFRAGEQAPAFGSVHLHALLARLLRIQPAPNAGSMDSTAMLLR